MVVSVTVLIEGRVQGVGFRYWVAREAERLGIDGWVRNRQDGTVEALFSGDEDSVERIVSRCHQGPSVSHVTAVTRSEADPPVDRGFRTMSTAR